MEDNVNLILSKLKNIKPFQFYFTSVYISLKEGPYCLYVWSLDCIPSDFKFGPLYQGYFNFKGNYSGQDKFYH